MQRVKAYRRFPRSSFVHRIQILMDEADKYKHQALRDTQTCTSPVLQARLLDKANQLDLLWHDLAVAQTTLSWYLR